MIRIGKISVLFLLFLHLTSPKAMTKQENFLNQYGRYAMINSIFTKVPASITLAQAILESGWGESSLTTNANNFFGIKAHDWTGPIYTIVTDEYENGQYIQKTADFRKYRTPLGSFKDHAKFLRENQRYDSLFSIPKLDYVGWANGLQQSGYATSPTYASKLISIIKQYKLDKYDKRAIAWKGSIVFSTAFVVVLAWYYWKFKKG